jgi:uncharacterized protein
MAAKPYVLPGVYQRYITIAPAGDLPTGVPVFIGLLAAKLAQEVPQETLARGAARIQRWEQFAELYPNLAMASRDTGSHLGPALRGFFANGGGDCFVQAGVIGGDGSSLAALSAALRTCEALEGVDLVCAPDLWRDPGTGLAKQTEVLAHCARCGDRFAILDGAPCEKTERAEYLDLLLAERDTLHSTNGALYAPWLCVANEATPIPPCGHVAGIYAAGDRTYGPHRAPANVELAGVIDIDLEPAFNPSEQARLAENGVNSLRALPSRGIRVWGAQTLAGDETRERRMIGARRLLLSAGRWAAHRLAWVTFEPNTPRLWAQVRRELEHFCGQLLARGALQGATPADAYVVKCDAENNPPELRDRGELVAELSLAPSVASEFVVVQIICRPDGVSVREPSA